MDAEDGVLGFERVCDAIVQGELRFDFLHVVLAGFNEFSPRLSSLIDALHEQGVSIAALRADQPAADQIVRVQASDGSATVSLDGGKATAVGETGEAAQQTYTVD